MLSSQMTAEDEEAVADEMKLLQREVTGETEVSIPEARPVRNPDLPEVPTQDPVASKPSRIEKKKEERTEKREEEMLAA